jgi:hypothetical protein
MYEFVEVSYSHLTVSIHLYTVLLPCFPLHGFHTTQYNLLCIFMSLPTFQIPKNSGILNFCDLAVYIIRIFLANKSGVIMTSSHISSMVT